MSQWFVMYTKPRQEAVAVDNLERQQYRVFFPKAKVRKRKSGMPAAEVVEPLFPRYMFVKLESGVDDFSKLRSTKGCVDLVKFGGKATPVPDELIDLIQAQVDDSDQLDLAAVSLPAVGSTVRVEEGPFEGLLGTIANHKSADRVLVLLNVLGAQRRVELGAGQVEKVAK